jgi:hypothetical protein
MRIILRSFVWFSTGLLFFALFSMMSLQYRYTREMPEVAQQVVGRVCPVSVYYGKTVFVTEEEKDRLSTRYYYILAAGILVVFAEFARRVAVAAGVGNKEPNSVPPHEDG